MILNLLACLDALCSFRNGLEIRNSYVVQEVKLALSSPVMQKEITLLLVLCFSIFGVVLFIKIIINVII